MVELEKFYQHCKVDFSGDPDEVSRLTYFSDPNVLEKKLRKTLDKIVERFPDGEEALEQYGEIIFCTPQATIDFWVEIKKAFPQSGLPDFFLQHVKFMKKEWENIKDTLRASRDLIEEANNVIGSKGICPDGHCAMLGSEIKPDGFVIAPYVIQILLDERINLRNEDYMIGVIAHEFAEFTTKYYALQNHMDEINSPEDHHAVIKKYTKSGTIGEEYSEHEKIVNREAARLGFKKEIIAMDGDSAF